jgi:hypothetical protein
VQACRPTGDTGPPDRLKAAGDRALCVRQRCDASFGVPYDRHPSDLHECDEPLVSRVVRGSAVIEQDVGWGLKPGDDEVLQTPQVEHAAHHRMHATHQVILVDALVAGPEGEV